MEPDPYSLDNLHDIVEPAAISWWPPAMGLWITLALLLVWMIAIGLRLWIRYKGNSYRREALALLKQLEPGLQCAQTRGSALAEVAMLLKRTALSAYPREGVAKLSGEEWLAFLDHSGNTHDFSHSAAAIIGNISWQPQAGLKLSDQELKEIIGTVHHWINHHHPQKGTG
jgi:hypothetical protein